MFLYEHCRLCFQKKKYVEGTDSNELCNTESFVSGSISSLSSQTNLNYEMLFVYHSIKTKAHTDIYSNGDECQRACFMLMHPSSSRIQEEPEMKIFCITLIGAD